MAIPRSVGHFLTCGGFFSPAPVRGRRSPPQAKACPTKRQAGCHFQSYANSGIRCGMGPNSQAEACATILPNRTAEMDRCPVVGISVTGWDGAGDGIRTRDINLGKVALYQLSYSRAGIDSILPPRLCDVNLSSRLCRRVCARANTETRGARQPRASGQGSDASGEPRLIPERFHAGHRGDPLQSRLPGWGDGHNSS
jgi:hypothetical protein